MQAANVKSFSTVQWRIIALWAFTESVAGGVLHGLHIPFTGLFLASVASVSMAALAASGYSKGIILRAALLVMIIKVTLSPHTPATAFFALSVESLCGELLFSIKGFYKAACYLNSVFALTYSAIQKMVMLMVLFGKKFFTAFDEYVGSLLKNTSSEVLPYSIYIVCGYILLHFAAGILAGRLAAGIPLLLTNAPEKIRNMSFDIPDITREIKASKKRNPLRRWLKNTFAVILIVLLFYLYAEKGILADKKILLLIARAVTIIALWYFFTAPLLMKLLLHWLNQKKNRMKEDVLSVLNLLPEMRYIFYRCWNNTSSWKGLRRLYIFIKLFFYVAVTAGRIRQ